MKRAAVAFRVDASREIGHGHLSRCLTLAGALRARGISSEFVLRQPSSTVIKMVRADGYVVKPMVGIALSSETDGKPASTYARWLGLSWREDARQTLEQISTSSVGCLVVDHYGIDHRWERELRSACVPIAVIDGLANRVHDCDLLLDQTYSEQGVRRWRGLVPKNARLLVGPRYTLLRPEFPKALALAPARAGQVSRILIAFGGSEQVGVTALALDAVLSLGRVDLQIDVVIGPDSIESDELRMRCSASGVATLHVAAPHMAALMNRADLAIGAAGVTMWERAFLGLPSIVISIADHEEAVAECVAQTGAITYLGPAKDLDVAKLRTVLAAHIADPARLQDMSKRSRMLVGNRRTSGSSAVARHMERLIA